MTITPYLLYEDVAGALEFLAGAFGFETLGEEVLDEEGRITHAAMKVGDGVIMMGFPGPGYQNPKRLGQATQHLYVYVENVDMHFERSREAGARILEEPLDTAYGDRRYGAEDPEGHHWYFARPL
jgi:uncharacterized glyoxalase superfamily protein PhnB